MNNFITDTRKIVKKAFLNKFKGVLVCSLFLTGIITLGGIAYIVNGFLEQVWAQIGVSLFTKNISIYVCFICVFISLIKITYDNNLFSKTLIICIRTISFLLMITATLIPRLKGFHSSGFDIFSKGDFVLIDGSLLLPGLLLLLLSILIQEGFQMQKELDEIL